MVVGLPKRHQCLHRDNFFLWEYLGKRYFDIVQCSIASSALYSFGSRKNPSEPSTSIEASQTVAPVASSHSCGETSQSSSSESAQYSHCTPHEGSNSSTDDDTHSSYNEESGNSSTEVHSETESMEGADLETEMVLDPIRSGDLGVAACLKSMRRLTDNEKFYLLKHHYASSKGYQFPARAFGAKQR